MFRTVSALVVCLVVLPQVQAGFITNGSFESGNSGFKTEYIYSPGNLGASLTYDIVSDPHSSHASAASYGDHTTGAGLMMMLNGNNESLAWSQTMAVSQGGAYDFSIWVSSWTGASPARLDFLFNNVSQGIFTPPAGPGVWGEHKISWNSGTAKSLTIEIRDRNDASDGNDFALDDISLNGPSPQVVPAPPGVTLALVGMAVLCAGAGVRRLRARKTKILAS